MIATSAHIAIEAAISDDRSAFVAFSGGKESVVLASLCKPWRHRISLVWINTGHMAPHMVKFVRDYGQRFKLIELCSPDLETHWREKGLRIPIHSGRVFRFEAGHRSDLMSATVPI